MTQCWFCGTEMIWGGDHSFEDYGMEGDGIVANLSCPGCGATAEYYTKQEEDDMKDMGITEVRGAKANISDLVVYGDGDTFRLLCKASSQEQGWMKSTKVCNVGRNCIVQVTTQQRNPDGSYAVAEALTFVQDANIDTLSEPRRLVSTKQTLGEGGL